METPNKDQIKKELQGWLGRNLERHRDSHKWLHAKALRVFCILTPAGIEISSGELLQIWLKAQEIVAEVFADTEIGQDWVKTGKETSPEDIERIQAAHTAVLREFMRLVAESTVKGQQPEELWDKATLTVAERSYLPIIESDSNLGEENGNGK